jgi:hypothetical protein
MQRKNLMAKAHGITTSINKKSREERSSTPTGLFADDYNRLRDATAKAYPDLEPLLPPRVQLYEGGNNTMWSHQGYAEIDAFAEQIYQLLAEQQE